MRINKYKPLLILLGLITISCVLFYAPYIIKNLPLWYGTDIKPQWFFFYTEFKNLISNFISNHSFPFYAWDMFLGTNFYASKSYYLMGDIFSYIGLLFKSEFFTTAMFLEIIKFYVAGLSMYALLSKFEYKPIVRIIGSVGYVFSGWAIFFSGQLSFLSFYCLMPLYFLGIEQYLKDKKFIVFIISSSLLLFTNFYFFFTLSWFTVLYYTYRYYLIKDNFKSFLKDTLIIIGYYLIGVSITMILTLPTLYYILGVDRIGNFKEGILFQEPQVYLSQLISTLIPNYLYIYRDNAFETTQHYTREICTWAGSIIPLLLPQVFASKDKKYKKGTIILLVTCVIIFVFPVLDSIVHGFSDPSMRWTCILIIFNILIASKYLNDIESINKKVLRNTLFGIIGILVVSIPLASLIKNETIFTHTKQMLFFAIFIVIFIVTYFVLIDKSKKKLTIILLITFIEVTGSGLYLYQEFMPNSIKEDYNFVYSATHVLQDKTDELNNYLNSIEEVNPTQYYRVYVPHETLYWQYSHNMSVMYQLNGTMTYDSTYAPSLSKLKELEPEVKDFESEWIFNIKDGNILDFLSVKYAVVQDESELPSEMKWRLINDNYRSGLQIYRNDDYRELGVTYSKVKAYEDYSNAKDLLNYIVCENDDYEEISSMVGSNEAVLENISYYNNQLTGYAYCDDDSFMVISLPYDKGWNIKVNNKPVKTYSVNGGFIGFSLEKGDNNIEMYFTPAGFKLGTIISSLGICVFIGIIIYNKRRGRENDSKSNTK